MLEPSKDRHNYSDLLTPPGGYDIDFAIGTTYSLDLEALLGVPLSLSLAEEMDESFLDNPIYALEALRRSSDRFIIFCEAGQIKVPKDSNNIFLLLEDSVFEVALKDNKSFHPKVWVIKYINKEGEAIYRFLVLSRNLTFDRSWDVVVALEGKLNEEATEKNKPLIDFLSFLTEYTEDSPKKTQINQIISELKYVNFDPNNRHFPEYEFHPLGIEGYSKDNTDIFDTYHHAVVISPFITESIIKELNKNSLQNDKATKVLITRKSELHKLTESLISDLKVYTLRDSVIDGESSLSGENEVDEIAQLQDIHAKLYARTKYNNHLIYVGSANSTYSAFNGNVEFLLKLKYKKNLFKIEDLLIDLFGEDEKENPFELVEAIPDNEINGEDLDYILEKGIKKLCQTQSNAYVTENNNAFDLTVHFNEVPSDVEFKIRPLQSKIKKQLNQDVLFENLSMLELGEFYIIEALKCGHSMQRIIKIETKGIPSTRDNEIFRSIVKDPHTFLMYIAFLLADDFLITALENPIKNGSSIDWNIKSENNPVLYENLLRAAAQSAEKLYDIEEVVKLINDDNVVPPEFNHLYETFLSAARKVRK